MSNLPDINPSQIINHSGSIIIPNTLGEDYCCIAKVTGICDGQEVSSEEKITIPVEMPVGDQRELYWAERGYQKVWEQDVSTTDYGRTAQSFFQGPTGPWSNGEPTGANAFAEQNLSFQAAPDGRPAFRIRLTPTARFGLNCRGYQLGMGTTYTKVVVSREIWIEAPGTTHNYIGVGHDTGSRPGVYQAPGGSVNRTDSYTYRAIYHAPTNNVRGYLYDCENTGFGDTALPPTMALPVGRWVLMESEIILNTPASSRNGIARVFLDCALAAEHANDRIRCFDDVYHRGAGIFVQNNVNPPAVESQYIGRWKIMAQ